jgi:kinesin family protein 11
VVASSQRRSPSVFRTGRQQASNNNNNNSNNNREQQQQQQQQQDAGENNIRVIVRCRGRNEREIRENCGTAVKTHGVKGTSLEVSIGANPATANNKIYYFDGVFSPAADQAMIYDDVVTPMMEEVSLERKK